MAGLHKNTVVQCMHNGQLYAGTIGVLIDGILTDGAQSAAVAETEVWDKRSMYQYKMVLSVHRAAAAELFKLTLKNGFTLTCAPDQLLPIIRRKVPYGYRVAARDVLIGDTLTLDRDATSFVTDIEVIPTTEPSYGFTTDSGTYIAGGVIVCGCDAQESTHDPSGHKAVTV